MAIRREIEYDVRPRTLNAGQRWLSISIKNIGATTLSNIDVRLNSLDTYGLEVPQGSLFLPLLAPGEERELSYNTRMVATTSVYITMSGMKGEEGFYWESAPIRIQLATDVAEVVSVFAQRKDNILVGDTINCEATVKARTSFPGPLTLDVWAESPDGQVEEIKTLSVESMPPKKTEKYKVTFSPGESGLYSIHAELYNNLERISKQEDIVLVTNP